MGEPARHLHLVNPDTGEVFEGCPDCELKDDVIAGLERDIRGWAARFQQLKRDKTQLAKDHPKWSEVAALFDVWRRETGHTRSLFDADSFWLAVPFYEKHGQTTCLRAIAGARFDPYVSQRKNGSRNRHDDWTLIFRDRAKFEDFANRAPRGWTPEGGDATG